MLKKVKLFLVCCFVAVMFAYEQCLLCLGHHPDVWIEAAAYVEQASKLLTEKGVCVNFVSTNLLKRVKFVAVVWG